MLGKREEVSANLKTYGYMFDNKKSRYALDKNMVQGMLSEIY